MKRASPEAAAFILQLRSEGLGRATIVKTVQREFPDVSRWQVELVLYPSIAEKLGREKAARHATKPIRAKPLPKPTPPPRVEPAFLSDGVPDLNRLVAWVERAKRLMPADQEPAFDITHALRRLDLIERTHAYRITTQAEQSASIQ